MTSLSSVAETQFVQSPTEIHKKKREVLGRTNHLLSFHHTVRPHKFGLIGSEHLSKLVKIRIMEELLKISSGKL
jgi:hypothetical protein